MSLEAVVALKMLSQSKRRLSSVLNDQQRQDLVKAMAWDVLSCLMAHSDIRTVHAVCGEGWSDGAFPRGQVVVWQEPDCIAGGLIDAYEMVADNTIAERLLFIHADLPFLVKDDISAVITASEERHSVFSPDLAETGTNAVLRWRHHPLPLCFGEQSFERHKRAAKATGTPWRAVRSYGVARDIDEPDDLRRLEGHHLDLGASTARWMNRAKCY